MKVYQKPLKSLVITLLSAFLMGTVLVIVEASEPDTVPDPAFSTTGAVGIQPTAPASPDVTNACNPNPPSEVVKLVFIHHSVGGDWIADWSGGLGIALGNNNYFVSDTYYGWGPPDADLGYGTIGDHTDIGHWYNWFVGPHHDTYLNALYATNERNSSYSRWLADPGGENEIIMFKSCFPNSELIGNPDEPPTSGDNPLRGVGSWSEHHTVGNAKGIYNDILGYFGTRQDKLFVVITAPPVQDETYAANARAFNNWLVHDWLDGYPYHNVAVFDFYNVLTTNGGDPDTNDYGWSTGNHHRVVTTTTPITIEHITDGDDDASPNVLEYPRSADNDHPNPAGGHKATGEFVPLLNVYYNCWKHGDCCPGEFGRKVYLPIVSKQGTVGQSNRVEPATADNFCFGSPFGHIVGVNDTWTTAMVVVDLDGDGDPDLVTGEIDGRIMAWQNDGSPFKGEWTGHQVSMMDEWWTPLALAADDLNNDGDADLVAGTYYHGLLIWENDGNPFEGEWSWLEIGEQNVGALALADVDGDGRLDIVAGGGWPWEDTPSEDYRIMVWHGPEAPFSDTWQATDVGLAYYSVMEVDVGDLDNDGDNDIVIGTWPAPAVGDVDNPVPRDQWPDVYQIRSFRNDGGDNWTEFNVGRDPKPETLDFVPYVGFWGATVTDVALTDLDNDGDLDIAATERSTGDFLVMAWQNDGTPFSGELWAPTAVAIGEEHNWLGAHVYWVEPGDFDRDGDLDLVSGNGTGEPYEGEPYQVMVWENSGVAFGSVITDTSWVRHNVGVMGKSAYTGGVADFDGDGYLDLVAGALASESDEIRLWENYGLPVPRIQCQAGYTAVLYAQGLSSPDGLAFDSAGVLHVAEETAGRVSRIEPGGSTTTVVSGLANPEGIAFDTAGNLYVVEDVQNGRLVRVAPGGGMTGLTTGRDAPEGVVWASDGTTYITESNVEFTSNPSEFRTRVTAVSPSGGVTVLRTDNLYWSYAGITMGADGLLYVTNEASGTATTDSIFTVDPATGERALFASGLVATEGLRFAANGDFPLYVVEEDIGSGAGRLSRVEADGSHAPFCTGFYKIEDVVVDESGRLYVSEDDSGWIIAIEEQAHRVYLPVILRAH